MGEKKRPFKIIDLKDYADVKDFTFDYSDWSSGDIGFKSLKEVQYVPEYRLPKNFTDEEKLDCINYAYGRADELAGITAYVDKFHEKFLDILNETADKNGDTLKVSFEYEEDDWDSIKLRVNYGVEFIVGDSVTNSDGDNFYHSVEEYMDAIDFESCIKSAKDRLDNFYDRDEETFKDEYMTQIKEKVYEIKQEKMTLYTKVKANLKNNQISERKKIFNFIKMINGG